VRRGVSIRAILYLTIPDGPESRQEAESKVRHLSAFCETHGWTIVAESAPGGEMRPRSGEPVGRPRLDLRRDQVLELRQAGRSWRQIARAVGASIAAVRRACKIATGESQAHEVPEHV
jgi:hypothetical protein